jgi:hypothetical protein
MEIIGIVIIIVLIVIGMQIEEGQKAKHDKEDREIVGKYDKLPKDMSDDEIINRHEATSHRK